MKIINSPVLLLFLACLIPAEFAHAVTRNVTFTQVGRNVTRNGLEATAKSSCRITVSNQSGQSQTIAFAHNVKSLSTTIPALNNVNATYTATTPASPATVHTLAPTVSITYTFDYATYPTATAGSQELVCSGTLTANDSGASPGFLIASGVLVTFIESGDGEIQSQGGTGTVSFNGMAVYTQVPITINRGQPF